MVNLSLTDPFERFFIEYFKYKFYLVYRKEKFRLTEF